MKKQSISVLFLLWALPGIGFAQTETTTIQQQTKEEIKQHIQERFQGLQLDIDEADITEKREEIKSAIEISDSVQGKKLQFLAQERVHKLLQVLFERLEATVLRQEQILARIEARIEILRQENQLPQEVEAELIQAKKIFEESTIFVIASKQELLDRIETEISIEQIRLTVQLLKQSLVNTHVQLVQLVQTLKISEE